MAEGVTMIVYVPWGVALFCGGVVVVELLLVLPPPQPVALNIRSKIVAVETPAKATRRGCGLESRRAAKASNRSRMIPKIRSGVERKTGNGVERGA